VEQISLEREHQALTQFLKYQIIKLKETFMSSDFWLNKWKEGDIRFHQSKYHPQLEKNGHLFSEGTILVPLCGKTLDMLFLSSLGHHVIGVELSPIACRDFFLENGIQFTEKNVTDFIFFESSEITLWCGDFFKLPQAVWDLVTGIYDRAALVALPENIRKKYAEEISERTKKSEVLLVSFEYAEGALQGPPFSVPEKEVKELYSTYSVQTIHIEKSDVRGTEVFETVYWITK
jgi:thiopurine S-methyltransferase